MRTTDPQHEQAQRRLRAEEEGRRAEAERLEVRRLAEGGKTSRQRRAAQYLAYVRGLSSGRWAPGSEAAASHGTVMDQGAALRTAEVAAKQAVADALAPLIEQAEAELQAATAERDAIVKRGRLT